LAVTARHRVEERPAAGAYASHGAGVCYGVAGPSGRLGLVLPGPPGAVYVAAAIPHRPGSMAVRFPSGCRLLVPAAWTYPSGPGDSRRVWHGASRCRLPD